MSQMLDTVDAPVVGDELAGEAVESPVESTTYGQFEYTPMPVLAPVGAVLGVCSLIAFVGLFGIILSAVGIVIAALACVKILRSQGAYTGMKPALSGLALSVFSAVGGTALMVYNYRYEVPEGFERVSFSQQISKTAFLEENGIRDIHPNVKALVDKPIFLKGFMYPTGQMTGLTEILLLKDSGQCCFGGQPKLEDMVGVKVKEGLDVDHYAGRVSVAGTFKINPAYTGASSLEPLFQLEVEYFSKAKTAF
ncbi:MAG: hypothetical protein AB7Q45_16095 [Planctomycetaceae bacterium]